MKVNMAANRKKILNLNMYVFMDLFKDMDIDKAMKELL
jgi:hypothetical protein